MLVDLIQPSESVSEREHVIPFKIYDSLYMSVMTQDDHKDECAYPALFVSQDHNENASEKKHFTQSRS